MNGAVILAAGSSSRMGGLKKEFLSFRGRSLLYHGVKTFLDSSLFSWVLVTCPIGAMEETRLRLGDLTSDDRLLFSEGGASRQESVRKSLDFLKKEKLTNVLIHDGARPFVSRGTIRRVLESVEENEACIPVEPAVNTMKLVDEKGRITAHLERRFTVAAQTPQGFRFAPLLRAHRELAAQNREFTDDAELWSQAIGPVYTVEGNRENRKITYPEDLTALGIGGDES